MSAWPLVRDLSIFLSGMAIIGHETLASGVERPTLLLLAAAMIGLPAFLRIDERRQDRNEREGKDRLDREERVEGRRLDREERNESRR